MIEVSPCLFYVLKLKPFQDLWLHPDIMNVDAPTYLPPSLSNVSHPTPAEIPKFPSQTP